MNSRIRTEAREREQEIMSILLSSPLSTDMPTDEREQLLNYLVTSYFEPCTGEADT